MIFDSEKVQRIIGYSFKDERLLKTAFTHKSFHSKGEKQYNNERLEFLGDSLLGFIVADHLYKKCKGKDEGIMTKEKHSLVSTKPLAQAIKNLALNEYIIQGESLDYNAGTNDRLLENLFEALVAALYLDGGFEVAKNFVVKNLLQTQASTSENFNEDYKSSLQIYTQSKKLGIPTYETVAKTGPEHNPQFTIAVIVAGKTVAVGSGTNKSRASQDAARRAINKLIRQE